MYIILLKFLLQYFKIFKLHIIATNEISSLINYRHEHFNNLFLSSVKFEMFFLSTTLIKNSIFSCQVENNFSFTLA